MIAHQARHLLERTHQVRFLRGQLYDTAADEFLAELIEFLTNVMEIEVKMERQRGLLLRAVIYIAAEQRSSDRPQGKAILADLEAALK